MPEISACPDVEGDFNCLGNNLIGDKGAASSGFTHGMNGDQAGITASPINPLLGALWDNGGFTQTHALLGGSPAIDPVGLSGSPIVDQRGFLRGDGSPDIGAYEASASAAGKADYLDRFDAVAFNGDDGALPWANDWQEIGEASGAAMGAVSVWNELGEQGLYLWAADDVGVWRQADLSGATTATLSFDWAMTNTELGDQASLQISTDGVVWDTLDTFDGPLDHSVMQSAIYDISAYIDNDTRIRFETISGFFNNDVFFVDNVRIELASGAAVALTDKGEFLVNDTVLDQQQTMSENRGSLRSVAIAPDGDYVVVWSTQGQDASNWGVYAQRFDSSGTELGAEFQVNSFENNAQYHAAVDMDDAGNFVVVWTSENQDGTASSVYARMFNADGSEAVAEFRVNTQSTGSQGTPMVAMTGVRGFVVTWQGEGPGDSAGIFARRFDAGGTALDGTEILVNTTDRGTEVDPAVAVDDAGNFVVAWTESNELYFQRFSADGNYAGGETRPIPSGSEFRSRPAVAMDPNGNFTIAWYYAGGSGNGVWARVRQQRGGVVVPSMHSVRATSRSAQAFQRPHQSLDQHG